MTDCAVAGAATSAALPRTPRRRTAPDGVPSWVRLLGVTVMPVSGSAGREGQPAPGGWIVSAGAGPGHVAALFYDDIDHD
jgi:hypothetical protein